MAPARRLTVVQLIPRLHAGGAERSTLEISRALVLAGHRSVVISAGGRMVEQLQAEGGEHITLDLARKSLRTLGRLGQLRRLLQQIRPDIVHARSRLPAWLGWWAIKGLTPRPHFVTTVHGLNSPGRYSAILLRGEKVIAVSQTLRDYVLSHYRWLESSRVRVIPRGIDAAAFPYGHRPDDGWTKAFFTEYPALAGAPLLTLPARGTRLKGHHDAIELLADLKRRGVEARLLLLGVVEPGREEYLAELQELIRVRGVTSQVVLTPSRSDVRDIYAISTLVLQLSNKPESFGRTVIEALSLCRPVLGYAHGGVGELLAELYPAGRVPPGDREKLVDRAAELLRVAPPIAPLQSYRLVDMQQATLALYAEVAGS
ncbi:glycosyltransferase involved in cell wall biosynthesis [Rhodanobacter sp. ANJX3]|jgi:glycosyltransferase involved in cell wall biosynthesis|uniref:glycosyltransferase n=1 Tax=unclassified Rhodanobacter TaxID=2621553 RepID=UPI0018234449|nr:MULTISPECIES: glycosyltransferase [unclassified Rhodanobacter]MBB5359266.1 glycosyltransferase involved in cell wall biosynthesis [Rhodanobacter sp. ANJX3]NYE29982.1 glycosyltransferase involved in cell wall biosynthesis [Rhodanobacter sp. K2T2]